MCFKKSLKIVPTYINHLEHLRKTTRNQLSENHLNEKSGISKRYQRKLKTILTKFKAEAHDGFCPVLKIWRPATTFEKDDEVPEELKKFKWIRDPITDQWIDVRRIGLPARVA